MREQLTPLIDAAIVKLGTRPEGVGVQAKRGQKGPFMDGEYSEFRFIFQ
jgi:hypothetical protein